MGIFTNQWLIGVGTGVFSGLLVTLMSGYLLSRKAHKEYIGKIVAANHEILYTLRSGISEVYMPEERVLTALINATARKYAINPNDIFQIKEICEELIKEIMDSSFITTEMKKSYSERIAVFTEDPIQAIGTHKRKHKYTRNQNHHHVKPFRIMSLVLGSLTALFTMVTIVYFSEVEEKVLGYKLTAILALAYIVLVFLIFLVLGKFKSKQDLHTLENLEDSQNTENTEDTENTDNIEDTQDTENTDNIEDTEDIQNSDDVQNTEENEDIQNSESSQDTGDSPAPDIETTEKNIPKNV